MWSPTVSVVVSTYNSAWSIRDTLRSVLRQSLSDLELIVVDDGSTDALADVLRPFEVTDSRLRVVRQANAGLAGARNRGLAEARGEFVAFLDADDLWHPRFLEKVIAALRADPHALFGYALMIRIDTENRVIPTPRWQHEPRHDFVGLLEVNTVGNGSASVFRRSAISAAGGYDTTLRDRNAQGAEDWKLTLTLAARRAPVLVAEQLVAYRVVPGGMSRGRPDVQLRGVYAVIEEISRAFPGTPARHFLNARTVMHGWIMPAYCVRGRWGRVPPLLWDSYVRNPLWFLSRDVRAIHVQRLRAFLAGWKPRRPLADLEENGSKPFAFLAE